MISANFLGVLFVSLLIANFVYSSCIVEVDNQTSEDLECTVQYNSSEGHFIDGLLVKGLSSSRYYGVYVDYFEFDEIHTVCDYNGQIYASDNIDQDQCSEYKTCLVLKEGSNAEFEQVPLNYKCI